MVVRLPPTENVERVVGIMKILLKPSEISVEPVKHSIDLKTVKLNT